MTNFRQFWLENRHMFRFTRHILVPTGSGRLFFFFFVYLIRNRTRMTCCALDRLIGTTFISADITITAEIDYKTPLCYAHLTCVYSTSTTSSRGFFFYYFYYFYLNTILNRDESTRKTRRRVTRGGAAEECIRWGERKRDGGVRK